MLEGIYTDPKKCTQLRSGPLGPYLDAFAMAERKQGFSCLTVREHLLVLQALNTWLSRRGLDVTDLNEARLEQFVGWRRRRHPLRRDGREVIRRLLIQLREAGIVQPACDATHSVSAIDRVIADFGDHLTRDRGLVRSTVVKYSSVIREFLQVRYANRRIRFEKLRAADLQLFVTQFAQRRGRKRAKDLVQALRAFLRWLLASGLIASDLAAAVVGVANWRLSSVPATLTPPEIRQLFRSCNRRTKKGRRDFAVLMLLARLGLRAGEIVGLRLDDIDWRSAELTVHRKGDREDRLPLPHDTGEALVAYLCHARPNCTNRHVFLCMNAPYRALGHSSTVSAIVAAALDRAGLSPSHRGAHLLRHSLACQLLQQGATLTEIGDVLGHRSSGATEIYAKVDLSALRTVALPWPGESR